MKRGGRGDHRVRLLVVAACALFLVLLPRDSSAQGQTTRWDVALPWSPAIFHVDNARRFADEVRRVTEGAVDLTVRPDGATGVAGDESLRAVQEGRVPMAQFLAPAQAGDLPVLGAEALPFLVADMQQLRLLDAIARPIWADALRTKNQKLLYVVPWPSQSFLLKRELTRFDDLRGVRMRVTDKTWADVSVALRMTPQTITMADLPAALASGRIDGMMGSMTSVSAQRYWRFFKYAYATNHRWLFDFMTVNLDAWNRLTPLQQQQIEAVARQMEPAFWAVSEAEDSLRLDDLRRNNMSRAPVGPEILRRMREATAFAWGDYARRGPDEAKILRDFRARVQK